MLGGSCSPCCGCSNESRSEIHDAIWSRPMSLELSVPGYQLRQGAFQYNTMAGFAGIGGFLEGNQSGTNQYSESQLQEAAKAALASQGGHAYRTEGEISRTYSLSADMSQYYMSEFGVRSNPLFRYSDSETDIFVSVFVRSTGTAGGPNVWPGTNCSLAAAVSVRRSTLTAFVTGAAYLAKLESQGVTFITSSDSFYSPFTNLTEWFSAAVCFVNGADVFVSGPHVMPVDAAPTNNTRLISGTINEYAAQRKADDQLAGVTWVKESSGYGGGDFIFINDQESPDISSTESGSVRLVLKPYSGSVSRREFYDTTQQYDPQYVYKHSDPQFVSNPLYAAGQSRAFSWSTVGRPLAFGSRTRSFQATATIVVESA